MMSVLLSLLLALRVSARSRIALQLEILALRHQLQVPQRTPPRRRRLARAYRWFWVVLSRAWTDWRTALRIVKPETVIAGTDGSSGCRGLGRAAVWGDRRAGGRPVADSHDGAG
jgi:hypothetical protein